MVWVVLCFHLVMLVAFRFGDCWFCCVWRLLCGFVGCCYFVGVMVVVVLFICCCLILCVCAALVGSGIVYYCLFYC